MQLDTGKFALAGGIYVAAAAALTTLASLARIPGYPEFTDALTKVYGPYGYSATRKGIFVGAFWGFIEGFIHLGSLAFLYNKLVGK